MTFSKTGQENVTFSYINGGDRMSGFDNVLHISVLHGYIY